MDVAAFARGYLSLIGSSNQGEGLRLASDSLSPVLDITAFLGVNNRRWVQNSVQLTGGNQGLVTVPTGEMWRVILAGITVITGAGETADDVAVNIAVPQNLGGDIMLITPYVTITASRTRRAYQYYGGSLLLEAGTVIGIKADGPLVGTVDAVGTMVYELLKG